MESHRSDIFETIRAERNGVAEIHRAFESFPEGVAAHYEFYKQIVLAPNLPLSREEREYLAWKTSEVNACPYCIGHHKTAFQTLADLSPDPEKFAALNLLARELSMSPWKNSHLKSTFLNAGYSEPQWCHAVMVVSYFSFANRCAHAMGLELEESFEATCK